jgi:hypothetical protein
MRIPRIRYKFFLFIVVEALRRKHLIVFGERAKSLQAYTEITAILECFINEVRLQIRQKYFTVHRDYA